jgi:hypothetical protein
MGRYITVALMVGFLIAATDDVSAAMATWHWRGGCQGHKPGEVYRIPGRNACGEPATATCLRKGSPLPPPTPCGLSARPRLLPVDPNNRFGNAPIQRKLQYVTHDSPHFNPGALSIDKKRKHKRGLRPIDLNERIQ